MEAKKSVPEQTRAVSYIIQYSQTVYLNHMHKYERLKLQ